MQRTIEKLVSQVEPEAMDALAELVNTNSLTANADGVKQTGAIITALAAKHGLPFRERPRKDLSDGAAHLVHFGSSKADEPFYGIMGHFDTVHSPENGFTRLEKRGERLYGPGVQDMKGGIVVSLYSLVVLRQLLGRETLPVKVIFNCDEEVGSPDSRELIQAEMAGAQAAFVFEGRHEKEPGIITGRKGIMMGWMETRGKAAHAGAAPERGASAVVEAADKILKLSALNNPQKGDTVTVGRISGGEVANQIPARCRADLDVRFADQTRGEELKRRIASIMAEQYTPGVLTEYSLTTARPPFVKTPESRKLLEAYRDAAGAFGQAVEERNSGGGSDANLTGAMGVPTLDGLGPLGDAAHTTEEYIKARSLTDSIKAFTLMLAKLIN